MSTGFPDAPNGGMNFLKAASRSGGILMRRRPLSTQASESNTPEPPAPVTITIFSPLGVGKICKPRANSSMSLRLYARITPHGRTPGFEHHHGFLLRHALRHLGKRSAVFQIFDVHGDDLRVGILLEERQQVVLVNIRLVPQADDGR